MEDALGHPPLRNGGFSLLETLVRSSSYCQHDSAFRGTLLNMSTNGAAKTILEGLIGLFGQNRHWLLFFGTGTSRALDERLGMPELTEHLKKKMGDATDWPHILSRLEAGHSLEQALTGVGLSSTTKSRIQQATGDYIAKIDHEVRDDVLLGKKLWMGETLVKALVQRLPPRNPCLPIVTANYDMLIEYACTAHGIRYTTGFQGEIIRTWNWEQAKDSLNQCRLSREGAKNVVLMNPLPRVELFKLHGSINLFTKTSANRQIECDLWSESVPEGLDRVIAAPGDQKYEQYASIVDTAAHARRAENETMAFAVIGYGFNDPHLHERIFARVRSQDCPLIILTLDLGVDRVKELRGLGRQVWILVAPKSPTGDIHKSQTLVFSPCFDAPVFLDKERLWSCDCFAERILGG